MKTLEKTQACHYRDDRCLAALNCGSSQCRGIAWGHSSVGRALEWHSRGRRFDSAWLHQTLLASFIALSGSENMGLRRHLAALPWIIVRLRVHDHGSPKRSEEAYPQPFESAFPRFSTVHDSLRAIELWRSVQTDGLGRSAG